MNEYNQKTFMELKVQTSVKLPKMPDDGKIDPGISQTN